MTGFENRHQGQRCFLIASGPSVARMNLSWLQSEITICVNQAYKAVAWDPTYLCIGDRELWPRVKEAYARMSSTIICSSGTDGTVGSGYAGDNLGLVVPLDMRHRAPAGHFRHDLKQVCVGYNVVPEIALPFVLHCGFAECHLVGCDCTDDGYFYPASESARPEWPQRVLPQSMEAYKVIQLYADQLGLTRIINATYGGRLAAFPRVLFDSLRPGAPPAPLVIGYHTPHARYRELAAGMAASVRAFGLEVVSREVPSREDPARPTMMNWALNCAIKPRFVRDMQREFPDRDLIFLDADAVLRRRPALYLDAPRDYDFAAPYLTNAYVTRELQSNSLYCAATPKARALVDAWCAEQALRDEALLAGEIPHPYHHAWDQKTLEDVVPTIPGLRVRELPLAYAKIMPTPTGHEITPDVPLAEAVITQHQASREMRFLVGATHASPALPSSQTKPPRARVKFIGRESPAPAKPVGSRWIFDEAARAWGKRQVTGNHMPLEEAFERLSAAEFAAYEPYLGAPRRVLDLACGLGRVAIYLSRRLGDLFPRFVLADTTERQTRPRYGYGLRDAFYNDLDVTASFARANGLTEFETRDVRAGGLDGLRGWPDLVISMLGVGFHVPLDEPTMAMLHGLAGPETTVILGVACEQDAPRWGDDHDFSRWFSRCRLIPFTSDYPTHEGRVLILGGKVE